MSFKPCYFNYKIKFSSLYSIIIKFSIPRYFKILPFKLKYNKIEIKKQPVVAKEEDDDNEVYEHKGVTLGLKIENLYTFTQFIIFNVFNPLFEMEKIVGEENNFFNAQILSRKCSLILSV